jgi:hypothetical protein
MTYHIPKHFPFDVATVIRICKEHDVTMIGLFGSMARGDDTSTSDIDLIVRFAQPKSLIAMIMLEQHLAAVVGRPVDVLTEGSIDPYIRDRIYHDMRVLYEA